MSTVRCSVILRKGRRCKRKIKAEKAGDPPDCQQHPWIYEASEKLSKQQSLSDEKKQTLDNWARIAGNEKRSTDGEKRRFEIAAERIERAAEKNERAAERIERAAERIERAAEKNERAAEKIERAAEKIERAAKRATTRGAVEIPPIEEKRAERDKEAQREAQRNKSDTENREAYQEEGTPRKRYYDVARRLVRKVRRGTSKGVSATYKGIYKIATNEKVQLAVKVAYGLAKWAVLLSN